MANTNSTLFSLNLNDALKGFILGVGTPVIYLLQQLIPSWQPFLVLHLGQTGGVLVLTAISATTTYLIKNYFTNDVKQAQQVLTNAGISTPLTPAAPKDQQIQNNNP